MSTAKTLSVEELLRIEWKQDNISIEMEARKSLKIQAQLDWEDKVE